MNIIETMKRALEAIGRLRDSNAVLFEDAELEENLRAAIDAAEKQEPFAWYHTTIQGEVKFTTTKPSWNESIWPPLYTRPAPIQPDSGQAKIGCVGHDGDCCKGREQVYKDAARYRWLVANSFDRTGITQFHVWQHEWFPHSQSGIPIEWKNRVRGTAIDATIDAAMKVGAGGTA